MGGGRLPGVDPAWPDGSIRTSFLHRVLQDGDPDGPGPDEGFGDLLQFIVDFGLEVRPTDGYRAAPLLGLWLSAPYLHDGSVPTLGDLLLPAAERPVTFDRHGWTVDTTVEGSSNQGHEFGTGLSQADKDALVAYLLSL